MLPILQSRRPTGSQGSHAWRWELHLVAAKCWLGTTRARSTNATAPPNTSGGTCRSGIVIETGVLGGIRYMREHGHPFAGFLYAGLMLTADGPRVLEFNARLGDPETQPLMLRLGLLLTYPPARRHWWTRWAQE